MRRNSKPWVETVVKIDCWEIVRQRHGSSGVSWEAARLDADSFQLEREAFPTRSRAERFARSAPRL